jgi:hypothetical protein
VDGPQTRTLRRALEIAGSPERLAAALNLRLAELQAYLSGARPVPQAVYLMALDIVAGHRPPPR